MALMQVDFISESLLRTVTINVILPVDKIAPKGHESKKIDTFKTLYLLHGIYGNRTDYVSYTRIQQIAELYNLAVVMPSAENNFYIDKPEIEQYFGRFISHELVDVTRTMFHLSHKREDTFIAGLSMGGYGALINGLNHTDTFGAIGAFSPALLIEDLAKGIEDITCQTNYGLKFYNYALGGLAGIMGSDRDYKHLILKLQAEGKQIPKIFLCVGEDDFLVHKVRDYKKFLDERQIATTYLEGKGGHDWNYWNTILPEFVKWLPVEKPSLSLNSGVVTAGK